jgi:DNA repair exonuclease SbcCD ATPase subunit
VPASVEKAIDDLYGKPLAEFTAARDALVRELREAGDKAAADEVKGLRKPTVSAWAINQLARKERMRIRSLLVAGEKLRKAHAELLGGGRPAEVREASDAERKAINHLVSSAAKLLSETGHSASESALERVATTLRAAAVDDDGRGALERGRLTRDLDPTGFGPLDLTAKPGRQRSKDGRRGDEAERRTRERRQAVEEQLRALRAELRGLSKAVVDADGNVAAAERNLQAAEREARQAREKYERVERRLKDAESDRQHLRRRE